MAESIADRILAVLPARGCKLRSLRCALHDIAAAPLDYALQGLLQSGDLRLHRDYVLPRGAPIPPNSPVIDLDEPTTGHYRQLLGERR
jgi:hypothetical protein